MFRKFLAALSTLLICGTASAGFVPFGIQTNVDEATITGTWGWNACFSTSSNSSVNIADIRAACDGDLVMMGGKLDNGSTVIDVLAAASIDTVFAQTLGRLRNAASTNMENGVSWYRNGFSWGFREEGGLVNQSSADVNLTTPGALGLSWHTSYTDANTTWRQDADLEGVALRPGWCLNDGAFGCPNGSNSRVFYSLDLNPVPTPPLALLGLVALAGLLRRR